MGRAKQWRATAAARRQQIAVELILPSGATVKFCRPNTSAWLAGGRMPEHFVLKLTEIFNQQVTPEAALLSLSAEDQIRYATFLNDLVIASVIEPKIVTYDTDAEDEISLADIPEEDLQFILASALNLAPEVPVRTKGGDVPLKAVENFRDESERLLSAEPGGDGRAVQP